MQLTKKHDTTIILWHYKSAKNNKNMSFLNMQLAKNMSSQLFLWHHKSAKIIIICHF